MIKNFEIDVFFIISYKKMAWIMKYELESYIIRKAGLRV